MITLYISIADYEALVREGQVKVNLQDKNTCTIDRSRTVLSSTCPDYEVGKKVELIIW